MEGDLALPARSLDAVRLADSMLKMSGAFPHGWHSRYVVLNGNFLFIYGSVDDLKPRKVLCIDGAAVAPFESGTHRVCVCVTTRGGRKVTLEPVVSRTGADGAVLSPEELQAAGVAYRDKWIKAINNAQYRVMFDRTKAAVAFMDEIKSEAAAFMAAHAHGGAIPAKEAMSTADVVTAVRAMREAAAVGHSAARADAGTRMVSPSLPHVTSSAAMISPTAARANAESAAAISALTTENARLRAECTELSARNNELSARVARLSSELAEERAKRATATAAAANAAEEADIKLIGQLRQHVESLTEQLEAERLEHSRDLERLSTAMAEAAKLAEKERERERAAAAGPKRAAESALSLKSGASSGSLTGGAPAVGTPVPNGAPLSRVQSFVPNNRRGSSTAGSATGGSTLQHGSPGDAHRSVISGMTRADSDGHTVAPSVLGAPLPRPAATKATSPSETAPAEPVESTKPGLDLTVTEDAAEESFSHEWAPHLIEAQRLEGQGAYADAEQQFAAVLDAKREKLGSSSVSVAVAHRDLGRVLALERKFEAAEEQYSQAVTVFTDRLGENHPNTACALTDLAAVLREQEKFAEAETCAERAVKSLKAGVGAEDVSTATALYNLAGLAKRQGKLPEAEAAYAEALSIFRKRLGDSQGETADTLYQMGCLYRKKGNYMKAGTYFSQAADSYSKTYGASDKRVAEATKRAHGMAQKIAAAGPERPRRAGAAK